MGDLQAWGEWKPDVSSYKGQHSPTVTNAIPRGDGYGPMKSFTGLSSALSATCRGFFPAFATDGSLNLFAGTVSRLWKMSNTTMGWSDVSAASASEISYSGSTNRGDMTDAGGLAAAFDGTTAQAAAACAGKAAATTAWVGKTLAAAAPIHSVTIYGSNDAGVVTGINPTVTIKLYGKNGTAPANGTDGTELGTLAFTDTADESGGRALTSTDPSTYYLHVWIYVTHNGAANAINIAEANFFSATNYSIPTGQHWQFAQWYTRVIAVNQNAVPQTYVLGSSTAFATLAGSPPQASYVTTLGPFVVLSGLNADPFSIQWSSRNNPLEWTIGTNEGDQQTMRDGGPVRGMTGGEYGLVFQDRAIRRMTYTPGSATVFDFDVLSRDLGLYAPYSLVRVRDMVFFLSQQGFMMWHPLMGFKPIGKEKVDRTFMEDHDQTQKHMIIGTSDPQSSRIIWTYKSTTTATTDQFDRMMVYDWMLDRWAGWINIPGQYLSLAASPGITLESLDSVGNLDALTQSLDTYPTQQADTMAMANTSNVIGLLNGPALEVILETAEIDIGSRSYVSGCRPITDCPDVLTSVAGKPRTMDQLQYSAERAVTAIGTAPTRVDNRIIRYRNRFPAGSTWDYSIGVEPDLQPSGQR